MLQDKLNADAIGDDPVDWFNGRVGAQQGYAEETLFMAQQHRNAVAQHEGTESQRLNKLNWVVGEASKRHIAEQSYYPHRKSKTPRSRHHVYWLTAIGFLTISVVLLSVISWALWIAPFSTPLIRFVIRMIMPFVIVGLLIGICVTAISHFSKRWG